MTMSKEKQKANNWWLHDYWNTVVDPITNKELICGAKGNNRYIEFKGTNHNTCHLRSAASPIEITVEALRVNDLLKGERTELAKAHV